MTTTSHFHGDHGSFLVGRRLWLQVTAWIAALSVAGGLFAQDAAVRSPLRWDSLTPIPDANGFGSPFAGVSRGALILAGGTNFPDKKLWEGGTKVWYDSVFALDKPHGSWKLVGKLPRPLAGGVSVSAGDGVACLGGGDADRGYTACFLLEYRDGGLTTTPLPHLPKSCINFAGVWLNDAIYVAGGIERPDATSTLKTFWSLELKNLSSGWRELESWPGSGRMLATIGAQSGSIFLFSGTDLKPGDDGKPQRIWLKDAYRYTPRRGWQRIADLPRVAVAAPNPAPALGPSQLLVLGGDAGDQAELPPETHSGFRRDVLAYHTITNQWHKFDELPFGLVTTPTVKWNDAFVIPGGEERPGIRSNKVWAAKIAP